LRIGRAQDPISSVLHPAWAEAWASDLMLLRAFAALNRKWPVEWLGTKAPSPTAAPWPAAGLKSQNRFPFRIQERLAHVLDLLTMHWSVLKLEL
jgi:hypothetical protein